MVKGAIEGVDGMNIQLGPNKKKHPKFSSVILL
jgi:hypothetical protein